MALFPAAIDSKINQDSQLELDQRVVTARYGDNYEQRAAIGVDAFSDLWSLSIGPITKAELDTFRSFWNTNGFAESWQWTAPEDSTQKNWVFNSRPAITNIAEQYFIEVQAREVRD